MSFESFGTKTRTMPQPAWSFELAVKKAMILLVVVINFLFIFSLLSCFFNAVTVAHTEYYIYLAAAISYVVGLLLYWPVEKTITRFTERFIFRKKYDYQKFLKDASKGISNIESLKHLFGLVTHFITMKMRVMNAAILAKQLHDGRFKLEHHRGYEKKFLDYTIQIDDPLIQYLDIEREALHLNQVKTYMEEGSLGEKRGKAHRNYDFAAIKDRMKEMEAVCCVPSFLGPELRNVLILGNKKTRDSYTAEDLNILFALAQQSANAIENARLYDEAIKKTHELEQINHQLEVARVKLTHALQDTERANKQLQDTQAQLVHEQKMATLGRLAASVGHEVNNPLTILSMNVSRAILKERKNPDLKVSEIMEMFQKMEHNINRIKAVVNTLTGLLKKSEKGKFEPLSLKLILEETLPLVQFQTYLDNLNLTDVEFDVPGNIPLIRGDLERLQEVFLNLFINAYHALTEKRNPRIHVKAEIHPENPHMVLVQFVDNGKGMSEEVVSKVFNYGFTTKPPGRGSGLGLYMCKYIIELHGGTIQVMSQLGKGTTFALTLPAFDEMPLRGSGHQVTAS